MFVPCIIRRGRNDQQYALICTAHLFYILALTRLDSSLPSSGSFLDPSELLEIQIERMVYHIMCGYVACVPECRGSVCLSVGTTTLRLNIECLMCQMLLLKFECTTIMKILYSVIKHVNSCKIPHVTDPEKCSATNKL
jgi:hypothetical protein